MPKGEHDLLSDESILAWIADNEPGGANKLWETVRLGDMRGRRAENVRLWFERHAAAIAQAQQAEANTLAVRNVEATERAAKAAQDSAQHAKDSAFYAKLGVGISLAALFIAAWPSFHLFGK